jgi:hypothetical protein
MFVYIINICILYIVLGRSLTLKDTKSGELFDFVYIINSFLPRLDDQDSSTIFCSVQISN